MARRPWESLSPTYRKRLERAGITKAQHEKGTSLSKARGHKKGGEYARRTALAKQQGFKSYSEKVRFQKRTGKQFVGGGAGPSPAEMEAFRIRQDWQTGQLTYRELERRLKAIADKNHDDINKLWRIVSPRSE